MVMMVPPASHSVEALSKPHHPPPLSDLLLNPSVCIGKRSFCDGKDDDDNKLPVKLACIALESPPLTSQPHSEVLPGGELLTKYEPIKNPWPKKNQVWTPNQKRTKYEPLTKKEPSMNPWPSHETKCQKVESYSYDTWCFMELCLCSFCCCHIFAIFSL